MDLSTISGLIIGFSGILLGHMLESGHLASLFQGTAAIIVFGGTIGATLLSHQWQEVRVALSMLRQLFAPDNYEYVESVAKDIVNAAKIVRKESVLALEGQLKLYKSDFMKNVFRFMIDGAEAERLREVFNQAIELEERKRLDAVQVWSDAGGYAPTVGIIGAVLGLIHVMGNLTNTSELGKGIAVAFVATIYGVGSANLLFLPMASKFRRRVLAESDINFMIVDGAVAILNGLSPALIEEKMRSYTQAGRRN